MIRVYPTRPAVDTFDDKPYLEYPADSQVRVTEAGELLLHTPADDDTALFLAAWARGHWARIETADE